MKNYIFYALCLFFLSVQTFGSTLYEVKKITQLNIDSSINPAIHNYLEDNLNKLSAENGDLVLIKLDTPGGLVSTTKDILTLIGNLDFPVAIWITPEGASATSAGAIIASSAHFLVMSEGTNIGAATPITMGKDIEQKDAKAKALNDLVALVRSLSKARGRNHIPFEKMISEAKSLDAREALKEKVIDQIINSYADFVKALDKKEIQVKGQTITLQVSPNVESKEIELDPGQQILNIFANPTTAYVLFIIGAALIYFELQAPGGFIAGALGVLFLCLAGIGFQVLPLNIGAMGLILLSFILFVLEAYITSFGILTIAGIASLIFGSLFLFRTDNSFIELEQSVVFSSVGAITLYVGFVGWYFIKTMQKKTKFNSPEDAQGVISKILKEDTDEYEYQVKVHGEIWKAKSPNLFEVGEEVLIIKEDTDSLEIKIQKII